MFNAVIKALDNVIHNLPLLFEDSLMNESSTITDMNRKNLRAGKLSTGSNITPTYAATNRKTGAPDLYITGEFHNSIFVTPTNENELLVTSDNIRNGFRLAEHLSDVYTPDVFGVTKEQEQQVKEKAFKNLIQKIDDTFKNR